MELKYGHFRYLILFYKLYCLKTQFTSQQWTCPWTFASGPFPVRGILLPGSKADQLLPEWQQKLPRSATLDCRCFPGQCSYCSRSALFSNFLRFYFHTWKCLLINRVQWVCFSLSKKGEGKNCNRSCWVIQKQPELMDMRNIAEMAID